LDSGTESPQRERCPKRDGERIIEDGFTLRGKGQVDMGTHGATKKEENNFTILSWENDQRMGVKSKGIKLYLTA